MEKGVVQAYYGAGKGKTSAALGNAIKAAGEGKQVYIVQFMKGQLGNEFLDKLEPEIKIFRFEHNLEGFDDLTDDEKEEEKQNFITALNFAKKSLSTDECDVLVLDEIFGVIEEKLVDENDVLDVIASKSLFTSIILTGRNISPQIKEIADEVCCISKEK